MNCKGDSIPNRPHRMAHIVSVPDEVREVSRELLVAAAGYESREPVPTQTASNGFVLDDWILRHGLNVNSPVPYNGGRKWVFKVCPFNDTHTNGSAVLIEEPNGAIGFRCHHNSCSGNDWRKLREMYEPGCYDKPKAPEPVNVDISGLMKPKPVDIGDLEKEFGVQLFSRTRREVFVTNEGKTLLPYAIEMVNTFNKARTVIKEMHDGGKGKITIGCDVTSMSFPSKCLSDFGKRYPGISIELCRLDASDRAQAITGGDYDFCFMPRDMVPESSGIETVVTHTESLVVVSSAESPLKGRKSISLSELAAQRLVLLSESSAPILYMEIMDMMRTFHLTPVIDSTYDELIELYMAVLSHMGAAIVPQSLAEMTAPGKTAVLPIDDADTGIAYVMAWSKALSNPVGSLFVETVRKYALGDDGGYGL